MCSELYYTKGELVYSDHFLPGVSSPVTEQTSALASTDGTKMAALRKYLRCFRFFPANVTTLTWSLKTPASPAPSPESVSGSHRGSGLT